MILVSRDQELGQKERVPIGASGGVTSQHPSIREVGGSVTVSAGGRCLQKSQYLVKEPGALLLLMSRDS